MKHQIKICFTGMLVLGLAACGSPAPASVAGSSVSVPSSSAPASVISGEVIASSIPASSVPTLDTSEWKQHFVTLSVTGTDAKALLIVNTPADWSYDNYITFMRDEIKVAEIVGVWKITDESQPFSDEMTAPFAQSDIPYPEGYGLVRTTDSKDGALRTYLYKTWPDDADHAWYPHYMFYAMDGYVVQLHCYSMDASGEDQIFDAIARGITLHIT